MLTCKRKQFVTKALKIKMLHIVCPNTTMVLHTSHSKVGISHNQ